MTTSRVWVLCERKRVGEGEGKDLERGLRGLAQAREPSADEIPC